MKAIVACLSGLAAWAGADTFQERYDANFKETGNRVLVGRLSDVENAVGTTWHTLRDRQMTDLGPLDTKWQKAGIRNFRAYFDWDKIERVPQPGQTQKYFYADDGTDAAVKSIFSDMQAKQIQPYATLIHGSELYHPGCCAWDGNGRLDVHEKFDPAHPEKDFFSPAGFANFCGDFASRFHSFIKYYEIGNEPNNFGFPSYYGGNPSSGTVWGTHYADYYLAAAKRIREVQPTAKFITGGMDNAALEAFRSYLPKIAKYVNAIAIHPYADPAYDHLGLGPEGTYAYAIKPYTDLAAAYGIPEVWITEVGWFTPDSGAADIDLGIGKTTSTTGQAKYLVRGMFFYPMRTKVKVYGQWVWPLDPAKEQSGDLKSKGIEAYQNVHTLIQGSSATVALSPFKGTYAGIKFLDAADKDLAPNIETQLLLKNDKQLFFVFWLRGKQKDDFVNKPVEVTLSFPKPTTVASLWSHNVLLGWPKTAVPYAVTGRDLKITNTWLADYPNLIEIDLP